MTMEDERNLDLLVGELEMENRMMRARNERLEHELNTVTAQRDGFKEALERVLAVSKLALWDGIKEAGCDHCRHPLYAAIKCSQCGRVTE